MTAGSLIGRDTEIDLLDSAWVSAETNVVTIVAWGGVGKSALLNRWLATMAADGYRGAERVFAWSFYRQSESGQLDTSDQFLEAALGWFGVETPHASSVWERGRQLVTMVQQSRTLLLLDGLEGLQHPPGASTGSIKDPVLKMLVRELAAFNRGLCVVTSRLPVADIAPFSGQTCVELQLTSLSPDAGAALLEHEGVRGGPDRLRALSAEVEGHALTLRLLGSYIRTVLGGDAARWDSSRLAMATRRGGTPATRVMGEYDVWFEGRPEGQILALIGLFDRPASQRHLAAQWVAPVVDGLNEMLVGLDEEARAYAVANLRDAGLLLEGTDVSSSLDAHPLVRQHYRERHLREHPDAHREGHRRLFEHLCAVAVPRPRNLTETLPLVAAVWHGTQANLTGRALREVYWPRIAQDSHHLRDHLGAASSNYEVLSQVLVGHEREGGALSDLELARVLCDQALDLRMMGKSSEAVGPFERSIELARSGADWSVATNSARHLSQLYLSLGRIADAEGTASRAVQSAANLEEHHLERIACPATLGDVEHQRGDLAAAYQTFLAGGLSSHTLPDIGKRHAHRVTLYISIYRFCDLLVGALEETADQDPDASTVVGMPRGAAVDEVRRLAGTGLVLNESSQDVTLARALMTLARERVELTVGGTAPPSPSVLDETVEDLRRVGQRPWLVHGLLTRAALSRAAGRYESASEDLREAREVAVADGMVLQSLDCELEAARLEAASGNRWQARLLADSVARRVEEIGYGRLARRVGALLARLA